MRQLSLFLSTLLLLFVSIAGLTAQTKGALHLITCIDKVNDDIAEGCRKDYANADELFKFIAKTGGMNYRLYNLEFNQIEVADFIHNFQCGPNDLVVFLYSGHGFRYDNDGDFWPWPFMYLCEREKQDIYSETCELDLEDLYDTLKEKKPRMSIVIGNSCNEVLDEEEAGPITGGEDLDFTDTEQAMQGVELFTDFRGHIIVSASGPGQKAYTTDENGAYFIIEFFRHIAETLDEKNTPTSWQYILESTKMSVQERNNDQVPMYKIE